MLTLTLEDAVEVTKSLVTEGMDDEEIIRQELEQKCWLPPKSDEAAKRLNGLIFDINPAPEQRWIPVDLRSNSPEENKVVLLGVRFQDDFKYFITSRQDYNYWTGLGREIKGELRWQPLPEPYIGGGKNNG